MKPAAAAALFLGGLCFPAQALGVSLDVFVTDMQGGVLPDARVTVTCGGTPIESRTDEQGRVSLPDLPATSCTVTVSHTGFSTIIRTAEPLTRPQRFRLRLAPYRDAIEVTASAPAIRPDMKAAASAVVTREELEAIGYNVSDWVRYAKLLAGALTAPEDLMVDGFPTTTLPPARAVAQITINLDPFSAEFATPGTNEVDIVTRAPDAPFHWNAGGSALGLGGRNPLAPDAWASSHGLSLETSGALPIPSMAFSAQGAWNRRATPIPLRAHAPQGVSHADAAMSRDSDESITAMFFRTTAGAQWRATYHQARSRALNAGVGGLTLPQAALDTTGRRLEGRVTLHGARGRLRYRGGFAYSSSDISGSGATDQPAVRVIGALVAGAPEASLDQTQQRHGNLKAVFGIDGRRPFDIGILAGRTRIGLQRVPNPLGVLVFPTMPAYELALQGASTGIHFLQSGGGAVTVATISATVFGQSYLVLGARGFVRAGIRADSQTHDALRWSPRVFGSIKRAGFTMSGGAGRFTDNWPTDLSAITTLRDAEHLREFVADGVGLAPASLTGHSPSAPFTAAVVAPGLRRASNVIGRAAISRTIGPVESALEYTGTRGTHLLGSRRIPREGGWVDELSSQFRSTRHQIHVRLSSEFRGQRFMGHYQWDRSRDATGGPFATEPDGVESWVLSAGIAPWQASAVAMLSLPLSISMSVIGSAGGRAPYDITSTAIDRTYLFRDRAGLSRNSGRTPEFREIDLFASRRIRLPRLAWLRTPPAVTVGVQGTNLLGSKRYGSFGSVVGTDLFQQPLDAMPGRAARIWLTF